jgi:hypothetical protein
MEITHLLLDAGADAKLEHQRQAVLKASQTGNIDLLKILLFAGVNT